MNNLPTTPKPIGGAHAHAPILGVEVRYAAKIGQVCVEFATFDGAQVFSIQLEVAAAAQLAEDLADAVRTGEHHQDTASGGDPEDLPRPLREWGATSVHQGEHEDVATAVALAYDKGWAEGIEHAHGSAS